MEAGFFPDEITLASQLLTDSPLSDIAETSFEKFSVSSPPTSSNIDRTAICQAGLPLPLFQDQKLFSEISVIGSRPELP